MSKTPALFPTAAEIEAQTPPDRDRAIDVIRIAALGGVVALIVLSILLPILQFNSLAPV